MNQISSLGTDPLNNETTSAATSTNRGVKSIRSLDLIPPRFDYYRISFVPGLDMSVVRELIKPIIEKQQPSTKKYVQVGYDFCDEFSIPDQGSLQIFYGGRNALDHGINICAKGRISDKLAALLHGSGLEFKLSRADVCQDFRGNYSEVRILFTGICDRSRIYVYDKGACSISTRTEGRTVQGGSEKSAYQVICYEKGIQLGQGLPKDYLRLEHRFKPNSAQKVAFGKLSATEMLGGHKVATKLTEKICEIEIEPFELKFSTKEKNPMAHMIFQYEKVLDNYFREHGPCTGGEMLAFLVNPINKRLH